MDGAKTVHRYIGPPQGDEVTRRGAWAEARF